MKRHIKKHPYKIIKLRHPFKKMITFNKSLQTAMKFKRNLKMVKIRFKREKGKRNSELLGLSEIGDYNKIKTS